MRIFIDEVRSGPGARMQVSCNEAVQFDDLTLVGEVRVTGTLSNAASRLLLRAQMHARALLTCSRCADEFEADLEADLEEEFLPEESAEAQEGKDFPWSDVTTYAPEDRWIDLTEIIRQNALASVPIQVLCKPACKGLCSQCGVNLNATSCSCETHDIDPRLSSLRELQAKLQASAAKPDPKN
jgi:uncharacterized protein